MHAVTAAVFISIDKGLALSFNASAGIGARRHTCLLFKYGAEIILICKADSQGRLFHTHAAAKQLFCTGHFLGSEILHYTHTRIFLKDFLYI